MVEPERVKVLSKKEPHAKKYVLYWMQAAQRASWNPALEKAIDIANEYRLPLVVLFVLIPHYPEANLRSFSFMLSGIQETAKELAERGILLVGRMGDPIEEVLRMAQEAQALIMDCGYLRHQRSWRTVLAQRAPCPVIQVEGEVVVPVELAYLREAHQAAVLRRRILPLLAHFLQPASSAVPKVSSLSLDFPSLPLDDPESILKKLALDRSVPPVPWPAGTQAARARLHEFIENKLVRYAQERNNPLANVTSKLSPYLHFGQISPVEVAFRIAQTDSPETWAFLEELIVRRELAVNFVFYNPRYDSFLGLPSWAQKTLLEQARTPREALYTLEELDEAQTEDPLWNAAQRELKHTGWLHNYLRMWWGKQVLRWVQDPQEAFRYVLHLNNRYLLDGRDPGSYAGVGWCFGLHDRPFPRRPVFGQVRPMTSEAQKRKFNVKEYITKVPDTS